jgi:branched-chain amino acid transport system substrate-binding protein
MEGQDADRLLPENLRVSRRSLLKGIGYGAVAAGAGSALAACSTAIKGASSTSTKNITIGWIHPVTGDLAGFGHADGFVIKKVMETSPFKNGFKVGGKTYGVTIKSYDSQSSVTRAGNLARTAILNDNVDMLFASSTHPAHLREHSVGVLVPEPVPERQPDEGHREG